MHSNFKIKLLIPVAFLFQTLQAQPDAFLTGAAQVRPGVGAGVELMIIRNGITGPVRFVQEIPAGWEAATLPVFNAQLSTVSNQLRIGWLNFPLRDTVKIAYELKIPISTPIGNQYQLNGRIEYFEGRRIRQVDIKPLQIKTVKFYSRFQ
jgi:hypothetical protein